ncbi:hypothetical protein AWJ20_4273 [Sugiyamaella lignohabitans]|uniref:DUF895 domain membrane protein n=1 Tax=Sugiyamaella lignohabitans TaxID=796027 RepID=A0A161HFS3_9ASCO|nr:uncharacterized protein AWJ20_4273 [Sugiyamaella lignohabitans]ANB11461.1 hypothetical protein AWJ20_4273 [Sugiyamaella lignohabitans]
MSSPTDLSNSPPVEKVSTDDEKAVAYDSAYAVEEKRWYNTGLKVFGYQFPAYNQGYVQMIMVSFVCFLCPGMYNALSGLGGGGLPAQFIKTADDSNSALNATFAGLGFFSGTIINRIGVKWAISIGGAGYAIYSGSYLCFNHTENKGFVIAAGAILGMCAAMLWASQGIVIMAYSTEEQKGRFVAIFWAIFNVGAVIGSLVPLIQTAGSDQSTAVSDGTYAGFLALMVVGALLALLLMPTSKVVKSDGTKVIIKENPTWWSEIKGLFLVLKVDPHIILLFPLFFTSNWFYTYQFNAVNAARFNIRTRALNELLYWASQIIGALTWGLLLDVKFAARSVRARYYHGALFVLTMAIWGGGYAFEKTYTRETAVEMALLDWSDGRAYVGPMFLYMFYGMYDAIWQTYAYWLMGSLSNSSRKLALYAGFYKGLQSAGGAVMWRLDSNGLSYLAEFASSWGLLLGSLLIAFPVVWFKVLDHADLESDGIFTDGLHAEEVEAKFGAHHDEVIAHHDETAN